MRVYLHSWGEGELSRRHHTLPVSAKGSACIGALCDVLVYQWQEVTVVNFQSWILPLSSYCAYLLEFVSRAVWIKEPLVASHQLNKPSVRCAVHKCGSEGSIHVVLRAVQDAVKQVRLWRCENELTSPQRVVTAALCNWWKKVGGSFTLWVCYLGLWCFCSVSNPLSSVVCFICSRNLMHLLRSESSR